MSVTNSQIEYLLLASLPSPVRRCASFVGNTAGARSCWPHGLLTDMKVARFNVIRVALDWSPLSFGDSNVGVTARRVQSLLAMSVIQRGRLTSVQADSLAGKLGFALCTILWAIYRRLPLTR